jgi:diacylglycerol kinase family enzyme
MKPALTPDEIQSMTLQEAWSHAEQVAWVRENLTQQEIDRLVVAGVDGFVERCRVANQGERAA